MIRCSANVSVKQNLKIFIWSTSFFKTYLRTRLWIFFICCVTDVNFAGFSLTFQLNIDIMMEYAGREEPQG